MFGNTNKIFVILCTQFKYIVNIHNMQLREEIRQKVLSDDDTILAIAKSTGKKFRTIFQWLQDNSEYLTLAASLKVIKEFTGLTESEILTETTVTA